MDTQPTNNQPAPLQGYTHPATAPLFPPPELPHASTVKKSRKRARPVEVALLSVAVALLFFSTTTVFFLAALGSSLTSLVKPSGRSISPPNNSFSVVHIVGTIQNSGGDALGINQPSYNHGETVRYIKNLAENSNDKGILLYMDTGGGGIYESDEVYRALENYKEVTGRPVWVYMASTCASGGYYIAMAAEHITANYNTTTGSIGVYIALTDTSGLYDKLGVQTKLIRSGDNKGIGTNGIEITPAQQEIYQSIVDEHYARFFSLVLKGRSISNDKLKPLADGRPLTAVQAMNNGLVDELNDWESTLTQFEEKTNAKVFYPNFSQQTLLGSILGDVGSTLPKGEAEAVLEEINQLPSGVPLAYAPGLWEAQK